MTAILSIFMTSLVFVAKKDSRIIIIFINITHILKMKIYQLFGLTKDSSSVNFKFSEFSEI